ncbi:ADP-ribosylglycohydrolase family protein [Corynebacterium aquatimens]|uniref:ADP-ribosylglycohydrolase n=1 Tax=Corynebacterium aquatimens TaxID=1190508 RepID=A0A931E318_9CORY|nr:ADP-ribosylglycohydrolase family protein [Corynebacterium aquatimens]MBG6122680.1 ADP-ribosylglycohydrolase [Corynebacterium aquatimens]WJY64789.1 ADP-ribosyl-[dinitrogen reductase] glycohydrolase [Corynebacterium aquatimens]
MCRILQARARGAMYGQLIGDNLGALVEFRKPWEIEQLYPNGVRELTGGGPHGVVPGQATDDSEMALTLARSLVRNRGYSAEDVLESYRRWADSDPFDIGGTCSAALWPPYHRNFESAANGALMRISPLAIAYHGKPEVAADCARVDAEMTHPNDYAVMVNAVYTAALAKVISGENPVDALLGSADELQLQVQDFIETPPEHVHLGDFGWCRYAFNFTCYYAANGSNFEDDLVAIIGMGGDTDTNAAIAGAYLGAVYGEDGIPQRWRDVIDSYRTEHADRPAEYSPEGALSLVDDLLALSC